MQYKRHSGSTWSNAGTASATSATTYSFTKTGLKNGVMYDFRVLARNKTGYGAASAVQANIPRRANEIAYLTLLRSYGWVSSLAGEGQVLGEGSEC